MTGDVRLVLAVLGGLGVSSPARADQPWYAWDDNPQHEPWSYVPLISAMAGTGSTYQLGAHLRLRHGTALESEPVRLLVFGLGVDTDRFETFEPSAAIGAQLLPTACECWGAPVWLGLRFEVAAGYRVAEVDPAPFGSVKLGLGAVFSRKIKYVVGGAVRSYETTKHRFRSEADIVVKGQLGTDGRWTIAAGIELDPTRLIQDIANVFP